MLNRKRRISPGRTAARYSHSPFPIPHLHAPDSPLHSRPARARFGIDAEAARTDSPGEQAILTPSFPSVTCPVQANMTTGQVARSARRDRQRVLLARQATGGNVDGVERLHFVAADLGYSGPARRDAENGRLVSAASQGCNADLICTPAPIHNPDGSESLWCYTRPTEMYGQLRDQLGDFPLKHFWGPLANIKSTAWIVDSAIIAARRAAA